MASRSDLFVLASIIIHFPGTLYAEPIAKCASRLILGEPWFRVAKSLTIQNSGALTVHTLMENRTAAILTIRGR